MLFRARPPSPEPPALETWRDSVDCDRRSASLVPCFALTLVFLLASGCASGPPKAQGEPATVVSDATTVASDTATGVSDADRGQTAEPGSPTTTETEIGNPNDDAPVTELLDTASIEAPGSSSRESLEKAIQWAREGVEHYREGRREEAHKALDDARIALLEADLPEAMQEQGLAVLSCSLGDEMAGTDLAAMAQELALDPAAHDANLDQRDYIEREARRILRKFGDGSPSPQYLETFIDEVETYVTYYQGRGRGFFEKAYLRQHKYWPIIESTFEAKGIPVEQGYMAFVESGFNPRARSHADARGLWQFIPATGRRYGLRSRQDFWDVAKSTEAASEYLLDLIGIFGSRSFLLATAAYNAGEGRIMRCLRDLEDPFGDRSFWAIRPCLARETREYVPRILAAAVISGAPRRFGFDLPSAQDMAATYDVVTIPEPTSLAEVARQAGVSVADLRTANTDLSSRAGSTPSRNFPLYLPKGAGQPLISELLATPEPTEAYTELAPARGDVQEPRQPPVSVERPEVDDGLRPVGRSFTIRAQRGDSLEKVARRHDVTIADIKRWNPFLKSRVLYRGDRLTLYAPNLPNDARWIYTVKRGDTLSTIAARHRVRTRDLMRWNNLRSDRLAIGQELRMQGGDPGASRTLTYTVQRGNSLQSIAEIFEVRYRSIMSWNNLKSSRLTVGQKLTIRPSRGFDLKEHRVRRGETVGKIARRYGVRVSSLLTANGLGSRSVIRPGQRLRVFVRRT